MKNSLRGSDCISKWLSILNINTDDLYGHVLYEVNNAIHNTLPKWQHMLNILFADFSIKVYVHSRLISWNIIGNMLR